MSDVFREVDEEVRREQLKKLWDRYQYLIVGVVLLVVVGVGGWRVHEWQQTQQADRLGSQFENAIALADAGKNDEAESCCKQALATYEKAPGADPLGFAKALEEYATVLRNTNRAAQAEKLETRAKALREQHGQSGATKE